MNRKQWVRTAVSVGIVATMGAAGYFYQQSLEGDQALPEEVEQEGNVDEEGGLNGMDLPEDETGGTNIIEETDEESGVDGNGSSSDSAEDGGTSGGESGSSDDGTTSNGNGSNGSTAGSGTDSGSGSPSSGGSGNSGSSSGTGSNSNTGSGSGSNAGDGSDSSDNEVIPSQESPSIAQSKLGELPAESFIVELDTLFGEWSIILKKDQLPSDFQSASTYTITIDGKEYALSKNQFNANVFNGNIPASVYSENTIKNGVVNAKK